MKISGFRCETKFGLLVFLGHPNHPPVHQYDFFSHYIAIVFGGFLWTLLISLFSTNFLGVLQCFGIMLKGDDEDIEDEDDNDYDNDEDDGSQSQCLYRSLVRHELTSHPPTL